jgi:hypothetical protein
MIKIRLLDLLAKMISLKFLCGIVLTTVLLILGYVNTLVWMGMVAGVLGLRTIEKNINSHGGK